MKDIGLWKTKSEKGTEYYKGKTEIEGKEYRIALFINKNKKTDKSPDMTIKLTELKQDNKQENMQVPQNVKTEYETTDKSVEITDEDLPF